MTRFSILAAFFSILVANIAWAGCYGAPEDVVEDNPLFISRLIQAIHEQESEELARILDVRLEAGEGLSAAETMAIIQLGRDINGPIFMQLAQHRLGIIQAMRSHDGTGTQAYLFSILEWFFEAEYTPGQQLLRTHGVSAWTLAHDAAATRNVARLVILNRAGVNLLAPPPGTESPLAELRRNNEEDFDSYNFYDAIQQGQIERVITIIQQRGEAVMERLVNGVPPLVWAAYTNQQGVLETLLGRNVDVNAQDSNGDTALHMAARQGQEAMVRFLLLQHDLDLTVANNAGETANNVARTTAIQAHIEAAPAIRARAAAPAALPSAPEAAAMVVGWGGCG